MRFSVIALLAATSLATAQFDGVPECGVKCISDAVERLGCDINDTACSCKEENQSKLASDLQMVSCLTLGCLPTDLPNVIAAGTKLCAQVTTSPVPSATVNSGSAGTSGVASNIPSTATAAAGSHDTELNSAAGSLAIGSVAMAVSAIMNFLL